MFGVCLGLQSMAQAFGGKVVRADKLMHGKISEISNTGETVFAGLPEKFKAARYHSLVVSPDSIPDCMRVTATGANNVVMGLSHKKLPVHGVQFHPESIASEQGHALLRNFLDLTARWRKSGNAAA